MAMKPNNLIYSRGTQVKVLDYGLAWIKGEPKDRVQGTPEYMHRRLGIVERAKTESDKGNVIGIGVPVIPEQP